MDIITSQTGITIGVVVILIGGVVWATKLWATAVANQKAVEELSVKISVLEKQIVEYTYIKHAIDMCLSRISKVESDNNATVDRMARMETKIDVIVERTTKT